MYRRTYGKDRGRRTCNSGEEITGGGGLEEGYVNDRSGDARSRTKRRSLFEETEESGQSSTWFTDECEKRDGGIIDLVARELVHGNKSD